MKLEIEQVCILFSSSEGVKPVLTKIQSPYYHKEGPLDLFIFDIPLKLVSENRIDCQYKLLFRDKSKCSESSEPFLSCDSLWLTLS